MTIVSEIFRMVWLFWSLILFNFFKFLFHILYDLFCSVIYYLSYLYFIIKLFLCIHSTHTYLIYHTQWYTHHNTIITFQGWYSWISCQILWDFITFKHMRIWQQCLFFIILVLFSYTSRNIHIIMQCTRTLHINHDILQFINACLHTKKHTAAKHIDNLDCYLSYQFRYH